MNDRVSNVLVLVSMIYDPVLYPISGILPQIDLSRKRKHSDSYERSHGSSSSPISGHSPISRYSYDSASDSNSDSDSDPNPES